MMFIPNIIFGILLIFGIGFFVKNIKKIKRNIKLGIEEPVQENSKKRWANVARIALGQSKMVRRPISGILHITHNSKLESNKWKAGYKIVGDSGECSGTISSMIGNGTDFYDIIKISYLKNKILYKEEHQLNGRWFSESFNGPMFSLMNSINNNTQPETNINDAFETLLLVEKVIRSHKLSE